MGAAWLCFATLCETLQSVTKRGIITDNKTPRPVRKYRTGLNQTVGTDCLIFAKFYQ
jgi:hypothetical protein